MSEPMMKNDKDLKRNGSGYYDEPCYKTITAPPKPGEIWTHKTSGAYLLVIASLNGVYSTLRLTDVEREGSVSVMCKTPMYATPIMLGYCFENMLADFVKSVKGDEFTAVKTAVAKVLGVYDPAPLPIVNPDSGSPCAIALEERMRRLEEESLELKRSKEALIDENEGLKKSYQDVFKENEKLHYDLKAKEMAEKDMNEVFYNMKAELAKVNVYKEMYLELLDKLVCARAGAVND